MDGPLSGRRILVFVGDDYEDLELQVPKYRLLEAGAEVVVAGLEAGVMHRGKHGYPQRAEAAVRDLSVSDFQGLVVPGGWMPDKLRRYDEVKAMTRGIAEAGHGVASICHGPWIEISAGIVKGINYTSTPGIKDDLVNAGAVWHDEPVVVDGRRVSSRRPDDLPAFCAAMIEVFAR
ncbi:type 1 glutamine amidotransferase domain-containing protein [Mucisphaera calidilacus]|uniref:Cysteine protease YraA n=1 Tax=Mucisphaera calidilacus TaxID=2527982 RepID=A0A518BTB5_9BACT|nr:type 1 glutamine amidotransferase domain-containing protein [Mucisphaera calidilacus]QDU70214.1 Putative cysteine protease YraA [Mucisphaera calidilacus]